MKALRFLFLTAFVFAAPSVAAPQYTANHQIEIDQVWARIAPNEADTVSVFFQIYNAADKPDVLIGAASPAAESVVLRRGIWKGLNFLNTVVKDISVRARKTMVLRPGVYEVTLNKLNAPVKVGAVLPLTLTFRDAGPISVDVPVTNQLLGNRGQK